MKIVEKKQDKLVFIGEINESMANAVRRTVLEIPVLAIDEVEFLKNDSVLYDEIIAHRFGLVPLKNEKLKFTDECGCKGKGCSKCSILLKLSVKGPCTVYSGDLKGRVKPAYDKIPLTILKEGQELELIATVRLGRGIDHVKFSPGLAFYRNVAEIEIKECDGCKECVEACPLGILKLEGKKIKVGDVYKCDLCEACVDVCKKKGKEAISIKPGKEIIFFVESFGQIKADEILTKAVDSIKANLKKIKI